MKTKLTLLCASLLALSSASAQNSIWSYTGLGAAPATDDLLFIKDTSAGVSKTLTIANLLTSPPLTGTPTVATSFTPLSNDSAALGSASLSFADLFLASGGVININNGNWVATHTSGILTVGTGDLRITTAGTNTASAVTVGGTQTLTAKTLTTPTLTTPVISGGLTASGSGANTFASSTGTFITSTGANTFKGSVHNFDAVLQPTTNDAAALGTTTLGFSDLHLATGGTINIAAGNWVATHTSGILTVGTGDLRVTTAGTNTASVVTVGGTQTLAAKTFTTPVIGAATGTSLAVTGALTSSSPSAKIGYATGAGGAVTQATSRTTTVTTSPNPCVSGTITTTASSMAAQTPTTFTVTDSAVAATDVVTISKVSGDVDTFAWVNSVGAGSFTVTLFNSHASAADTTAFVFNFAVIKAVAN